MKKLLSILIVLLFSNTVFAQDQPAFWNDIQQFKKTDRKANAADHVILLLGSSSFTMWQNVHDYFPGKQFVNRAFGGSSLYDLNFYSAELLRPFRPKQIIIYCGENDFAADENLKPRQVFNRFKHFYAEIRKNHLNVPVAYVSIKLSPSREHLWPKFIATNSLIKQFMTQKPNAEFIDITKAMADTSGKPRRELFLDDQLHMTPAGYRIWAAQIAPYLK